MILKSQQKRIESVTRLALKPDKRGWRAGMSDPGDEDSGEDKLNLENTSHLYPRGFHRPGCGLSRHPGPRHQRIERQLKRVPSSPLHPPAPQVQGFLQVQGAYQGLDFQTGGSSVNTPPPSRPCPDRSLCQLSLSSGLYKVFRLWVILRPVRICLVKRANQ